MIKKIIAVFMAALMLFSVMGVAVVAGAAENNTTEIEFNGSEQEEKTTRNIQNGDGLVVPINIKQLKMSVIFKIFEKIIKFVLNLFAGDDAGNVDESIASDVSSVADDISQAIEEGSQFIDDNQ